MTERTGTKMTKIEGPTVPHVVAALESVPIHGKERKTGSPDLKENDQDPDLQKNQGIGSTRREAKGIPVAAVANALDQDPVRPLLLAEGEYQIIGTRLPKGLKG